MFLPENIDLGSSEKYILTVRIQSNEFMFSICDPENKKNFCLRKTGFSETESLLKSIQKTVFDLNFLTQQFLRTEIIWASSSYTYVPLSLFETKEKNRYYELVRSERPGQIVCNEDADLGIACLFGIESDIYNFLMRNLFNPVFYHHSFLLTKYFAGRKSDLHSKFSKMYMIENGMITDLLCFSEGRLQHCISYTGESANNMAYYALKLWEMVGFNQLEDQFFMSPTFDTGLKDLVHRYVKRVEYINRPTEVLLWNEEAVDAPIDLLSLIVCE